MRPGTFGKQVVPDVPATGTAQGSVDALTCEAAASLKDQHRAQAFPMGFRRDVIADAQQGDQSIAQVARSFGVSESGLVRWLKMETARRGCRSRR